MIAHNKIKTMLSFALVAMVFGFASANAEITLDGSAAWAAMTGTIDASDSDKLVVVVSGEHNFGSPGEIYDVTYDGVSLTKGMEINSPGYVNCTAADIWYMDNPCDVHIAGAIAASTNGSNYVMTAFLLSGTADGIGNTAISTDTKSVELTTTGDGSLVLAAHTMGGDHETDDTVHRNTAYVENVDADPPLTEQSAVKNGASYNGHVTGTAIVAAAGTATYSFTSNYDYGINTLAAEFEEKYIDPRLPDVDAGIDMISWSGAAVQTDPCVVNNSDPLTDLVYAWTASPSDGVVFTPNDGGDGSTSSALAPTVTITKTTGTSYATVVEMTLVATLDGVGSMDDSIDIDVYDDACKAAAAVVDSFVYDPGDFNHDCKTDLYDFGMMASQWLVDFSITEAKSKNAFEADFDGNFKIDLGDFAVIAQTWGNGTDINDLIRLAETWLDGF